MTFTKTLSSVTSFIFIISFCNETVATRYISEICENCDQAESKTIAERYEPEINCKEPEIPDSVYEQRCFSDSKEVIIANYETKDIWSYEVGHTNQGEKRNRLDLFVETIEISSDVSEAVKATINTYEYLAEVADKYQASSAKLAFQDSPDDAYDIKQPYYETYQNGHCEPNLQTEAIRLAFDARLKNRLSHRLEKELKGDPDLNNLNLLDSIDGRWRISLEKTENASSIFTQKTLTFSEKESTNIINQVRYDLTEPSGHILMKLNTSGTLINKLSIDDYISDKIPLRKKMVSNCVKEWLDNLITSGALDEKGIAIPTNEHDSFNDTFAFNLEGINYCRKHYFHNKGLMVIAYKC